MALGAGKLTTFTSNTYGQASTWRCRASDFIIALHFYLRLVLLLSWWKALSACVSSQPLHIVVKIAFTTSHCTTDDVSMTFTQFSACMFSQPSIADLSLLLQCSFASASPQSLFDVMSWKLSWVRWFKQKTLNLSWFNAGPASQTLAQR